MLRNYKDDREFYESLPKKRIGAGALLFYKQDLLILQPTYATGWILPGGTVQGEESPLEALHREIFEELGITIEPTHLISIDYISNQDVKGEYIQFLFGAKELSEKQAQAISLDPYELRDYKFVDLEAAFVMLTPLVAKRVASTLMAQARSEGAVYLENGRLLETMTMQTPAKQVERNPDP
ncbi:NUDIX hydrolase [Bdellovibrio sp. 22V]|uniref:NUDIX domain-containing protein n=1 Tax=Bdellovibrio TaxID=958 RepID=UPI002543AF1C|nr:NUDIX hydrolase [Bdellovibrio sp. 22V]WII72284.1 NUDIX hydrolase [Bdellovibrio sp. 22V]